MGLWATVSNNHTALIKVGYVQVRHPGPETLAFLTFPGGSLALPMAILWLVFDFSCVHVGVVGLIPIPYLLDPWCGKNFSVVLGDLAAGGPGEGRGKGKMSMLTTQSMLYSPVCFPVNLPGVGGAGADGLADPVAGQTIWNKNGGSWSCCGFETHPVGLFLPAGLLDL